MEQSDILKELEKSDKNVKSFTVELQTFFNSIILKFSSPDNPIDEEHIQLALEHLSRYEKYQEKRALPNNKNDFSYITPNCFFDRPNDENTYATTNIVNIAIFSVSNFFIRLPDGNNVNHIIANEETKKPEKQSNYFKYIIQPLLALKKQNEQLQEAWGWYKKRVLGNNIYQHSQHQPSRYKLCDKIQTRAYDIFSKFIAIMNYLLSNYPSNKQSSTIINNITNMTLSGYNEQSRQFNDLLFKAITELLNNTYSHYIDPENDKKLTPPSSKNPGDDREHPLILTKQSSNPPSTTNIPFIKYSHLITPTTSNPIYTQTNLSKEQPFLLMKILAISNDTIYATAADVWDKKIKQKIVTNSDYNTKNNVPESKDTKSENEILFKQMQGITKIIDEIFYSTDVNNYIKYIKNEPYRKNIDKQLELHPIAIKHLTNQIDQHTYGTGKKF